MQGSAVPDTRRWLMLAAALLAAGYIGVGVRLVYLQVINRPVLAEKAERQQTRVINLPARRGAVYDRQGRELAVSIEAMSLYAVPDRVENPDALAKRLASVMGEPAGPLRAKLTSGKSFVWLVRKAGPDLPPKVDVSGPNKGVLGWLPDNRRYYPDKELACHVLGFTGMDNEGLEGLEGFYETAIGGVAGRVITEKDGSGREFLALEEGCVPSKPGTDVVLTIDEKVQYIAEKALDSVMAKHNPISATAIVMESKTGAVLALANRPGFNPNSWQDYKPANWRDRAVTDVYEPGSTFKIVTAAAALEEGVVRPTDSIYVGDGEITVGGRTIHDAHKEEGSLSFAEVIQKSSNVGTVKTALKLGKTQLYKYARAFGFGEKTGVDLPGEVKGTLRDVKGWSGVSLASVAIGQEVGVTALQMLTAMNCIANGGELVRPYIVSEMRSQDGTTLRRTEPTVVRRAISEVTAKKMSAILKNVVEDGGTAVEAGIRGYQVAGKTGTSQKYDRAIGRYSKEKFVSSFVGYVPEDDPKITVIVVVDEPKGQYYGGLVAAPAFKEIVEQTLTYMKVPTRLPDQTILVER